MLVISWNYGTRLASRVASTAWNDVGRGVPRPLHPGQQGEGEAGWEGTRWEGVVHARPCIWKTRGVDDALYVVQCLRQQGVHPEQVPQVLRQGRPAVRAAPRGDTEYVVFSRCDFDAGWRGGGWHAHTCVIVCVMCDSGAARCETEGHCHRAAKLSTEIAFNIDTPP